MLSLKVFKESVLCRVAENKIATLFYIKRGSLFHNAGQYFRLNLFQVSKKGSNRFIL